jgi:hypothetical protein
MNLKERDPRWTGDANLGCGRTDLLSGEALKLLFGLPHVRNPDSVVGFGDPMEDAAGCARAAGREPHPFDHLIVLLKSRPWKLQLNGNSHRHPPSENVYAKIALYYILQLLSLHRALADNQFAD